MKKLVVAFGCGGVLLVTLFALAIFNLDVLVEMATNRFASRITKTEVKIDDAKVSLRSGEVTLKGLFLGNPDGFQAPHAMKVASIFANLDEKTLLEDTIVLDRVEVVGAEITYEKAAGTDNFKTILNNVKASVQGEAAKQEAAQAGQSKKVVIRDFIIRDGTVRLFMPMLAGQNITVSLSEIHLRNLGKEGTSASEIVAQILASLQGKITSPQIGAELTKGLGKVGSQMEKSGKDVQRELEKAGDRLKGLLGQ
jgi:hypothetical protein